MFAASQYEFRSFPDIRRSFPSPVLKTEDAPTRWLNGELISWNEKSPSAYLGRRVVEVVLVQPPDNRFKPPYRQQSNLLNSIRQTVSLIQVKCNNKAVFIFCF